MPVYNFVCNHKKHHEFEQYLSFSEFDSCKAANTWPLCPDCKCPGHLAIPDEPPHANVVNNDTVGKIAENNSKKLGKFGVEDTTLAEEKRRIPKKPKKDAKSAWYGAIGPEKGKDIFNEKDPKKKKEKINKYVLEGK